MGTAQHNAASALESAWVSGSEIQAKLLGGAPSLSGEREIAGALQIRHSAGWHSYWRSPGESGLAPRFDWSGSDNLDSAKISFPLPKRYDEMGLTVFGYNDDVTFPLTLTAKDPSKDLKLRLKLDTMACKDICIPVSLLLALDIPAVSGVNSANADNTADKSRHSALIDFARSKVPAPHNTSGLKIENTVLTKEAIVVNAYSSRGFSHSDLFVEIEGYALPEKPEMTINPDNKNIAMIRVSIPQDVQGLHAGNGTPYDGKAIIITLDNGRESIERSDLFSNPATQP